VHLLKILETEKHFMQYWFTNASIQTGVFIESCCIWSQYTHIHQPCQ